MAIRYSKHKNLNSKNVVFTFKSESLEKFLARKPDFLIRHATILFFTIFVFIVVVCWSIQYPDIISVPAKLVSSKYADTFMGSDSGKAEKYNIQVFIPRQYYKKVKQGQTVKVTFKSFPYYKFGSLTGKVSSISFNGIDSGILATVDLVKGFTTDRNKQIPQQKELNGTAQIKTGNIRLIKRVFESVYKKFEN